MVDAIAQQGRTDQQRLLGLLRGKMIQKEILAGKHPLDSLHDPTSTPPRLRRRLDGDSRRHRDHCANFAGDGFASI
jgi:hypothetical protein